MAIGSKNRPNILIVQAGYPPEDLRALVGDMSDWFRTALGDYGEATRVVSPFLGEELPDPAAFDAAIVTGSWSMVTDREEWSERTADWIRTVMAADRPLLGVCYGHQLMAHALGGKVGFHPQGVEMGFRTISLFPNAGQDPLLAGLPTQFGAFLNHQQTVLELPAQARLLGRSDRDPHQIVRYGPKAFSIQFHPEFTPQIMTACIERERGELNAPALLLQVAPTPYSLRILRSFAEQAGG